MTGCVGDKGGNNGLAEPMRAILEVSKDEASDRSSPGTCC